MKISTSDCSMTSSTIKFGVSADGSMFPYNMFPSATTLQYRLTSSYGLGMASDDSKDPWIVATQANTEMAVQELVPMPYPTKPDCDACGGKRNSMTLPYFKYNRSSAVASCCLLPLWFDVPIACARHFTPTFAAFLRWTKGALNKVLFLVLLMSLFYVITFFAVGWPLFSFSFTSYLKFRYIQFRNNT